MSNEANRSLSAKEMLEGLVALRDRARVRTHLLTLDARARLDAVESGLLALQARLEQEGERVAAGATERFRELTQAAREALRELDGTVELGGPVRKLMRSAPVFCAPGDGLDRAAQAMWGADCGALPVVAADGSVVGMITDRDACMAAFTRGLPLSAMTVESAMSRTVHACGPDDSLGHAVRLMAEHQVRRLPVLEEGRLVGVLSLADLAREVGHSGGNRIPGCVALAHALAAISEPVSEAKGAASTRAAAE
jgi:CBS domain-containing protein